MAVLSRVLRDSTVYTLLCRSASWLVGRSVPLIGSGAKGSMTYTFTHMGNFLLLPLLLLRPPSDPSLEAQFPVSRPKPQFQSPNPSLEALFLASRPKSQPGGPDPSLEA